ncbi:hypothetical protein M2475_000603 [Breznakia sp. PF5-3]|uniref:DUF3783 domain-containing protein n=1 Tax=unclassified Breznakia TaxID=2623764 RepID=UPI0024072AC3|nr:MULTISPECIES: DUF3783 domain-containing protein [unclassified Breznakia]MDF9824366.1 hypothetical protein [Breznakia sp. PM6-1]MDF9835043.1 hypothetical protein [Breznakia sp. PF5-3]MDF9837786.1 hypothetical protein [Breznakia sp. PFB2-8]MDF9859665.1 hypothetical protein [Breznakia sp. PH5-24]
MKETLLIYTSSKQAKAEKIKTILQEQYEVRIIGDQETKQTIGYLFQLPGFTENTKDENTSFAFDMMILPIMKHEEINALSKQLRDQDLDIERKAMLTEHNRHWTLAALLKEVDEEHTYFMKRNELGYLIQDLMKIDPASLPEVEAVTFKKMLVDAYDVLQEQKSIVEDFQNHYNALQKHFGHHLKK